MNPNPESEDNPTNKQTSTDTNKIGKAEVQQGLAIGRLRTLDSSGREPAALGRRTFLRGTFMGVAGMVFSGLLMGCSDASPSPSSSILLPATSPGKGKPEQSPARPSPKATDNITMPTQITASSPSPIVENTPAQTGMTTNSSKNVTVRPGSMATGPGPGSGNKVLLVYFSRAGENYSYGGRTHLDVGNTEVAANLISKLIGCDVFRIEAADPYSEDYEETVGRNVREQQANARPAIANPLTSIEQYETVLLGSPIWNVRSPMIMTTFVEGFDFKGKTVFPFVTYAVSGLGTTVRDYTASCPGAIIGEGLAIRGEEVQSAGAAVEAWLRRIKLLK